MSETLGGQSPEIDVELERVRQLVEQHGGEEVFLQRFGMGVEELSQPIEFNGYQGAWVDVVVDDKCPVGGRVESAYAKDGHQGVQNVVSGLEMAFDTPINLQVSEKTVARVAELKKKRLSTASQISTLDLTTP